MMLLAAALMLAGALLLLLAARRQQPAAASVRSSRPQQGWSQQRLQEGLLRVGLPGSVPLFILLILASLTGVGLVLHRQGWPAATGLLLAIIIAVLMLAQVRRERQRRQLLQQLPGFIGQVSRRVVVGMSVAKGVERAVAETRMPLQEVLQRAMLRSQLGDELSDSLDHEGRITGVKELYLLASILRIHYQYGGSVTSALEHLVKLLHQRERAHRELWALTGETRVTAIVLGIVPVLMGLYMLVANHRYLMVMWDDPGGRLALLGGLGLQALGSFILWRMLRSI
ncbi:type II secretion system F family protein [Pokkaliibacter sp. MBI-7]|uniref:type II secretion system F family protein n=1 Tax=Pokkaliibacter sp. MBI-7 TaxID=3040600 RepID=UPI0024492673|nr:type II secretion system F family protein [Pokkaliibacter sp. MBI-7]MDH2433041.1 type II secretion system F family protein [Pokkaliibacter sp. MBI-7]